MHNEYTCLINTISVPIQIGIYLNGQLIEEYQDEGKTSDVLPKIFEKILEKYTLKKIIYANGPGSYMAIKVAYIFLKTLSITKKIEFKSCSGFSLNENSPIKALGKKYFVNKNGNIDIDFYNENMIIKEFRLPKELNDLQIDDDTLPNYQLPAV